MANNDNTSDAAQMVGACIRRARVAKGWSQVQLAEAVDTSPQTINRIETGKRNILAPRLMEIAAALEVPVGQLFENGDGLTGEERELIAFLRKDARDRAVIQSTVRGLRESRTLDPEPDRKKTA